LGGRETFVSKKVLTGINMKKLRSFLIIPIITTMISGCSTLGYRVAVPKEATEHAIIPNLSKVRFYADTQTFTKTELNDVAVNFRKGMQRSYSKDRSWNVLSISGGGSDGAYGAGILNGWSKSGTRPVFDVVTGVSTGSIIAPFAFLGSKYDPVIKDIYLNLTTDMVLKTNILSGIFGGSALTDNTGLANLIKLHATPDLLSKIGTECRKGRYLMLGTSDLDTQRGVIWNICELANSNAPNKLALFRRVILASAAIPGAFPPVKFDVEADGKQYNELHVDGGISSQVFLYPPAFSPRKVDEILGYKRKRRVFVIRNSKVTPDYQVTNPKLLYVSARSIETLIKNQGLGDLYRIYALARRDNLDYNLTFVPASFNVHADDMFDPHYMSELYKLGESIGRRRNHWYKNPFLLHLKK